MTGLADSIRKPRELGLPASTCPSHLIPPHIICSTGTAAQQVRVCRSELDPFADENLLTSQGQEQDSMQAASGAWEARTAKANALLEHRNRPKFQSPEGARHSRDAGRRGPQPSRCLPRAQLAQSRAPPWAPGLSSRCVPGRKGFWPLLLPLAHSGKCKGEICCSSGQFCRQWAQSRKGWRPAKQGTPPHPISDC